MNTSQPKIFIAIAAYSDPELPQTLDSCLATARAPQNLRFGICWQFDDNQPIDLSRFKGDKRFRFVEHPVQESGGGSWARCKAQELWDGETYSMQIDSHMVFAPGWDASLIRMMQTFPSDQPLITMIAPLFQSDEHHRIHRHTDQGIRATKMVEWQGAMGWSPWFDWGMRIRHSQSRNRFLSGQFIFTLGCWTDDVRQDPDHYYWGEEFALSLRSYTHGYDFFLPDEMIIWHMLHTAAPPRRHWEHGDHVISSKNATAFDRLHKLAYSDDPTDQETLGRYSLGHKRTLEDYERFAGMDLKNKRAHPDVYIGRSPDPLTIKTEEDWADCITMKASSGAIA
ncbi:MAG: UDP-N-acetylglucosamine-transferase [Alphaproteobacteria bacterium]|nr:UDP-N-acetylglucosamine-transferase [Alphaproteobacteria bacterium]